MCIAILPKYIDMPPTEHYILFYQCWRLLQREGDGMACNKMNHLPHLADWRMLISNPGCKETFTDTLLILISVDVCDVFAHIDYFIYGV